MYFVFINMHDDTAYIVDKSEFGCVQSWVYVFCVYLKIHTIDT